MTDNQFIASPQLSDGAAIATWLHFVPHNQLIKSQHGGQPQANTVKLIDWHIIQIAGKYQVIAHVAIENEHP